MLVIQKSTSSSSLLSSRRKCDPGELVRWLYRQCVRQLPLVARRVQADHAPLVRRSQALARGTTTTATTCFVHPLALREAVGARGPGDHRALLRARRGCRQGMVLRPLGGRGAARRPRCSGSGCADGACASRAGTVEGEHGRAGGRAGCGGPVVVDVARVGVVLGRGEQGRGEGLYAAEQLREEFHEITELGLREGLRGEPRVLVGVEECAGCGG